eukprot:CAMPEP_0179236360 /NCGR_PEP_ID=MMETSP0797-20121207/13887_1 /TAXON_ID=47934 /ORGANISM="Dinophysis acuminata, Strain DAEP01" /LENGTH=159 /DNA_ID=CAMNT_0020943613 /DNA_START=114 /DNA_END=591 /DNA_ORIENTATION=+
MTRRGSQRSRLPATTEEAGERVRASARVSHDKQSGAPAPQAAAARDQWYRASIARFSSTEGPRPPGPRGTAASWAAGRPGWAGAEPRRSCRGSGHCSSAPAVHWAGQPRRHPLPVEMACCWAAACRTPAVAGPSPRPLGAACPPTTAETAAVAAAAAAA